ncbi:polysaccharide deacetylase family protein [Williamwhitmania taraxaci]|uniref:Alpha-amylase n=1 Tax=Williamwhitmania taraxaci TaxID=1640674 RepID=A0A1G6PJE8_9BACT|nr:alpha-amylase [Williamwhitmania taraxaci]
MRTICFYFQVHQPFRLRRYRFFDIGNDHNYYDEYANRTLIRKISEKCYLPANQLMLDLIREYGKRFKISYSISGVALTQFKMYAPDVLDSFKELAQTGCVEFIAETYSHSLSALKSREEFESQVKEHSAMIKELFGQTPKVFRNTELIYSDLIGEVVADMGYKAMLTEGAKHVLGWKSSNYLYANAINPKLKLLLKNSRLSDDIAFRFSNKSWSEWPLTTDKYTKWINDINAKDEVVNIFLDYETFGEHQWAETGIFEFMRHLPEKVFSKTNFEFLTPSEVAAKHQPIGVMHVEHPISWADEERDLTAWLGNDLQDEAFEKLYSLKPLVDQSEDPEIKHDWKLLQESDHFYYMCTKWFSDGDVHKYFNPYDSPYEAFINYMNVLSDFILRIENHLKTRIESLHAHTLSQSDALKLIDEYQEKINLLKEVTSKDLKRAKGTVIVTSIKKEMKSTKTKAPARAKTAPTSVSKAASSSNVPKKAKTSAETKTKPAKTETKAGTKTTKKSNKE